MKTVQPDPVSEMALLGAMIVDARWVNAAARIVQGPHSFYEERHAVLFRCLTECYGKNPNADLVDFHAWLLERDKLALVGGDEYLVKLAAECPSGAGAPTYAKLVADNYRRRRAAGAMIDGAERLASGDDTEEAVSAASEILNQTGPETPEVSLSAALSTVVPGIKSGTSDLIPIGLAGFDKAFGGIPRVGVVTVLGIPGSGKSALALSIVVSTALERRRPWRVFSFEVGATQMASNILAAHSRTPISGIRRGMNEYHGWMEKNIDESNAILSGLDVAFVETNLTAAQITNRCRDYAGQGVRSFVIDYAQNVPPSVPGQSEREKLADVVRCCQTVARELDALVILVSQPTLDAGRTDRALKASDVKGAQELWAGSDMIISVYRSAATVPRKETETDDQWTARKEHCELHVAKNKNGMVGFETVRFIPEQTRFE